MSKNYPITSCASSDNLASLPSTSPEIIKWAKAFPKKYAQEITKSRRGISLDASEYYQSENSCHSKIVESSQKQRAISTLSPPTFSNKVMHPLNFETIDLVNTPLSSLRSCSEFNKQISYHGKNGIQPKDIGPPHESLLSRLYAWTFKNKKVCVNTSHLEKDEQLFLVEQLSQRSPSKDERDRTRFSSERLSKNGTTVETTPGYLYGKYTHSLKRYSEAYGTTYSTDDDDEYNRICRKYSVVGQSSLALDMVFGLRISSNKKEAPFKEIELLEFSTITPTTATFFTGQSVISHVTDDVYNRESLVRLDESNNDVETLDQHHIIIAPERSTY